jgi:predicted RNase H-like HicB family nuclease
MKYTYPVIISKTDGKWHGVYIPDFDCNTQGKDLKDALYMAGDAISLMGIVMQDDGKELPVPYSKPITTDDGDTLYHVDVDFEEYRKSKGAKKNDRKRL